MKSGLAGFAVEAETLSGRWVKIAWFGGGDDTPKTRATNHADALNQVTHAGPGFDTPAVFRVVPHVLVDP